LVELVVAAHSPLVGLTVRDAHFRSKVIKQGKGKEESSEIQDNKIQISTTLPSLRSTEEGSVFKIVLQIQFFTLGMWLAFLVS